MEENIVESSVDVSEPTVVSDDWDDIDISDVVDDEAPAEPENQPTEPELAPEPEPEEPTVEPEVKEVTDQFTLKHLGVDKTVSRDEAIVLAQKGLDYDRIRGKLSEAEAEAERNAEAIAFINDLAKEQGITVREVIDNAKAAKLAEAEGIDYSVALGRVANERTKKELESERVKLQNKAAEQTQVSEDEQKRKADISDFLRKFPDVKDFASIPKEVWNAVNAGESLVSAYTEHQLKLKEEKIKELNSQLEAEKQNSKNKARSTGSQQTTGQKRYEDEFDRLWYEE